MRRGLVMIRRPDNWWVPKRGLFRASAYRRVGGIHPNEQGEYSADWTWLLHLTLLGDFVRAPGSISKQWPHDAVQLAALRKAGVAEIRLSPLDPVRKVALIVPLAVYPRLPEPVKSVVRKVLRRS